MTKFIFSKKGVPIDTIEEVTIDPNEINNNLEVKKDDVEHIELREKRKLKLPLVIFLIVVSLILVVAGLALVFVITPAQRISNSFNIIEEQGVNLLKDFEDKDLSNIDGYFNTINSELDNVDQELSKFDFLATLDATKGYYNNFKVAKQTIRKLQDLTSNTLPEFKEVLALSGFKVDSEGLIEVRDSDEKDGALTLILKEMTRYLKLYNDIEPDIIDILDDFKDLDPNYLPDVGGYNLKASYESLINVSEEFPKTSKKVVDFLKNLPDLVGSNKESRYLLILQNETEMRSSGGLLTAYGYMSLKDGEFGDDIFLSDMWNMQYDLWDVGLPMPYLNIYGQLTLMNLGCGAAELRVQDAGIYPDLHLTSTMVKDYYDIVQPYFPEKYPEYDYVLTLNLTFATNLIKLIQPLEVEGYGEVDAEGLYDFIKGETDKNIPDDIRKDIIKIIANSAKEKFLDLPLEKLPDVLATVIKSFQSRDIAINSLENSEMQAYLDEYGMSGRVVKDFEGDYFHLNEAQNCSLKLNKFIRDEVTQDVYINDDGSIDKNVYIKWLQTKVYEDGLDKQYSPTLAFSYRAWVRIMAPTGVLSFDSDGYQKSGYVGYFPEYYHDSLMDKQVSDNIIQFDHRRFQESDPILRDDLSVSYTLPSTINYNTDGKYKLLIQKHAGKSWGEKYEIKIHYKGETYSLNFVLDRDKVLEFKSGVITLSNYDTSMDWIIDLASKIPIDELAK